LSSDASPPGDVLAGPYARVRLASGEVYTLRPGEIIGRGLMVALPVRDPWVSEAHAMVSLRDGALKLLGLRGRFAVGRENVTEAILEPGLRVRLSSSTWLEVVEVHVPAVLLAVDHPVLGLRLLSGVLSVRIRPHHQVATGARVGADAIFWSDGALWFVRTSSGEDRPVEAGTIVELEGLSLPIVAVALDEAGQVTVAGPGRLERPLRIVARYDTVHLHREGQEAVILDGITARILSDLAVAGVPMPWRVVAEDIWPEETSPVALRRNWDAALNRLRNKLREGGIRTDLVRADRSGNFELFLRIGDIVDDQT